MMTGVDMVHIPIAAWRRRRPICSAGRLQVLFDTLPAAIGNLRAGKIRALAVTSKQRSASAAQLAGDE